MNSDFFRCGRCGKTLIAEEYDGHVCSVDYKGNRTIVIDFYSIGKDDKGREMIIAKGMDGIMYTLTMREYSELDKVPFNPSDETLQGDDPTNTGQNPQDCLNMSD